MQKVKFLTGINDKQHVCWFTTNTQEGFRNIMQYILDSCSSPKEFYILNTDTNQVYHLPDVAKHYGMRKRTFEERMNNIPTGNFEEMEG